MTTPPQAESDAFITRFLDDDPEALAMRARLERDPALSKAIEDADAARTLLRNLAPIAPPVDLARAARRRLRKRSASTFRTFVAGRLSVEVFVVVAVAATAAVLWLMLSQARAEVGPPAEVPASLLP
jgi:anti-sigma factor RsiW